MPSKLKYWIGVASRDHVRKGVIGGFAQLCHGKEAPLKRMNKGDWIIYYSSKENMEDTNKPYQKFTAIGTVTDDKVYPFDMGNGFIPYRRNISFIRCEEALIRPLIPHLFFIKDKKRWSYPFRFGHLEISEEDFKLIARQMKIID